jgi:hypothetical protein
MMEGNGHESERFSVGHKGRGSLRTSLINLRPIPIIKAEITGAGYKEGVPVFDIKVQRDGKVYHKKTK